ncbi:MAG: TolC family protein [Candidatus Gastranaerophilales bacterium]|nr:TolC family protein [Candidatus Gastranaerophilales bacterium]
MIKKILLFFVILIFSQNVFALDRVELNKEFFARFNDEYLIQYINSALDNNHDLKKADAVVEQYRQQVRYSLGTELPSFGVSANYLGIKVPRLDNFQLKKNAFALPFTANYEADLLLKNRDKTRSTKKSYQAAVYEEKGIYLALLSDVATVYTNILQYDELINLQQNIVNLYGRILQSENKKFERGVINASELNNSIQNLETVKTELEKLKKERSELLMQLAVLTGISPEESQNLKRGSLSTFEYTGIIPDTISSDVIYSRPDVMEAETKLEKAKIDIRVARKEFLPSFNITGIWAFNTISPGTFFSWDSSLAMLLAGASQDIFTGGKKIANLKIQKAKYTELFENYKQTDLEAIKEVNTSLCFIKHDKNIENNALEKLNYEIKNNNNSRRKFERGVISSPEYLNSQAELLSRQKETAQAKTQRLINYFTLYKAVGGML